MTQPGDDPGRAAPGSLGGMAAGGEALGRGRRAAAAAERMPLRLPEAPGRLLTRLAPKSSPVMPNLRGRAGVSLKT